MNTVYSLLITYKLIREVSESVSKNTHPLIVSHQILINQHFIVGKRCTIKYLLFNTHHQVDGNCKRDDSRVPTHQMSRSRDPLPLPDVPHAQHPEDSRGIQVKI